MIIKDSKDYARKFYIPLTKNHRTTRVHVLTGVDVDAICAVKILLHLFQCDDIRYSLAICRNIEEIVENFKPIRNTCRNVVLVNCGGGYDLVDLLELRGRDEIRVFIIDSRRHFHCCNLYSGTQIKILAVVNPDHPPPMASVFYEVKNSEGVKVRIYADHDLESDEITSLPPEDAFKLRRERREWNMERGRLLAEYNKFQSYEESSAIKMFKLAQTLSKDDHDLMFWALTGLCDMLMQKKIDSGTFATIAIGLQGDLIRLQHSIDPTNQQSFRLSWTRDLSLRFYRQWNTFDSLCNSPYTSSIYRTWESKGMGALLNLLAEMGFSLVQCKQNYTAMDVDVRNRMTEWFSANAVPAKPDDPYKPYSIEKIADNTFLASYGFNQKIQVCDAALGLFATVTVNDGNTLEENFHHALSLLSKSEVTQNLPDLMDLGKSQLMALRHIVKTAFEEKLFMGMNHYILVNLENLSSATSKFVGRAEVLVPLAYFLHDTYTTMITRRKTKRAPRRHLPMVLIASIFPTVGEVSEWLHVVGLPVPDQIGKSNFMGSVFDTVRLKTGVEVFQDSFDNCIVRIPKSKKSTFLDGVTVVLSQS